MVANCSEPTPAPTALPTTAVPTVVPSITPVPTTPVCAHLANETCPHPMLIGYDFASEHACALVVEQLEDCGELFEYAESIGGCRCCNPNADDDDSLGGDDALAL